MKFIFLKWIDDSAKFHDVKAPTFIPKRSVIEFFDPNMNEMYLTPKKFIKALKNGDITKMTIELNDQESKVWKEKVNKTKGYNHCEE
jgi:hypothetical protein